MSSAQQMPMVVEANARLKALTPPAALPSPVEQTSAPAQTVQTRALQRNFQCQHAVIRLLAMSLQTHPLLHAQMERLLAAALHESWP